MISNYTLRKEYNAKCITELIKFLSLFPHIEDVKAWVMSNTLEVHYTSKNDDVPPSAIISLVMSKLDSPKYSYQYSINTSRRTVIEFKTTAVDQQLGFHQSLTPIEDIPQFLLKDNAVNQNKTIPHTIKQAFESILSKDVYLVSIQDGMKIEILMNTRFIDVACDLVRYRDRAWQNPEYDIAESKYKIWTRNTDGAIRQVYGE
ncbi:hypothetical protein [Ralstonia phage RP13]|nr:hypothetical protein [Ralstonia phage RP13]